MKIFLKYTIFLLFIFSNNIFAQTQVSNLNYWVPFSGGDARPMQLIVDKFNHSHPNINVTMRVIQWNKYYETLNKSLQENKAPEIAIVHASMLHSYIQSQNLLNLDTYNIQWNNFSNTLLKYLQYNNSNYCIPLDIHPQLFYFNKKYLKIAHLLDKDGNIIMKKGSAGFFDFFNKLQENLPHDVISFASANVNIYPYWLWYSFYMQQNDNKGLIKDNKASFNNKAAEKALKILQKMRDEKIWNEKIHDDKAYNLFKFNKAATIITGTWATWNFNQNKKLDYGVALFPNLFDKDTSVGNAHTLVVLKKNNQDQNDNSIKFIQWLSQNSFNWALSGQVPANQTVTSSKKFVELPHRVLYLQAANNISFYPKNVQFKELNNIMITTMVDFMHSDISVKETLDNAEQKINTILGIR